MSGPQRIHPLFRMILPTAMMSAALLTIGGVAAWYLNQLQTSSAHLLFDSVEKVQAAEELEIISHELRYQLRHYLATHDENEGAKVAQLQRDVDQRLAAAGEVADTERERTLLDAIRGSYTRLFGDFQHVLHGGDQAAQATELLDSLHDRATDAILKPAHEFLELTRHEMEDAITRQQSNAQRVGWELVLLGSCGAVAGLLLGYGIARGIHRSLAQLTIPVRDAAGRLNEVVGPITLFSGETFEELETELQRMADRVGVVVSQLQTTQLAALRAQQLASMGQLAAGLAHELRNPLTSMKMLLQPSSEDGVAVQLNGEDQAVLCEEIERLERTIQTFLDYARPPRLERRPLVLRELLAQTVAFVTPRAQRLGIEIRTDLPREVVQLDADAAQMRQVLLNLLLNAIESVGRSGTIDVRMWSEPRPVGDGCAISGAPESSWMVIEVADRGRGLPADLGDRIFEPFVSTKEVGTGLGLPTCRRILEEHGGDIVAENRTGGGAVFTIRLPGAASGKAPVVSAPRPS
jgi:two-component system, NtrC family, sensor histidine kinase HydH